MPSQRELAGSSTYGIIFQLHKRVQTIAFGDFFSMLVEYRINCPNGEHNSPST